MEKLKVYLDTSVISHLMQEDVPEKTIFVIITDGMENASRRYTYSDVQNLIENQKEKSKN